MKIILLVGILLLGMSSSLSANVEELRKDCDGGSGMSCMILGSSYESGKGGLKQDDFKAVKYYAKACSADNAIGCGALGNMYYDGRGVKQNDFKAVKCYTKACTGGDGASCNNVGSMYAMGRGVKQSYSNAKDFFGKACDNGSAKGCKNYAKINKRNY